MRSLSILACTAILLVLPGSGNAAAKSATTQQQAVTFFRSTTVPAWADPLTAIPPTTRHDPVVVRLSETQVWTGANPAILVNRATQVNDKSQLGEIGQYGISYFPAYQKLYLHRVAILRGDQVIDRTATAQTRLLEREPSLESGFYIGSTTVQLLLSDIRVGDTLWITYTTTGHNPVFGNVSADDFSWDYVRAVEQRRLTIAHPVNSTIRWRELGDVRPHTIEPTVERSGQIERLRFSARSLEAFEPEAGTPRELMPFTMIQTSAYADWQEVARWAANLFNGAADTPAVTALAKQFSGLKTEEERSSAALHWVQDEIRYFSVALGENSHRPQAPDVVLKRRYGDCKDKSRLLIAILARMGIKAEPVLVSAAAPGLPAKILPSPSWFDHVIVRVHADGKTYFIDPTREGEKGLLSTLPTALPGAAGLVVASATTALSTLPDDAVRPIVFEAQEKFVINKVDGDVRLEVNNVYRGKYASIARLRYAAMSPTEKRNDVLSDYEKNFRGATLTGEPVTTDGDNGASFTISAALNLPKAVLMDEGWPSIAHHTSIFNGALGIPDKLARKLPFELPLGRYKARYRLHIVWPEHVKLTNLDAAKTIDNTFFRAHKEYAWRGNETHYLIDYEIKRKQIAATELPELDSAAKLLTPFTEGTMKFDPDAQLRSNSPSFSVREGTFAHDAATLMAIGKLLNSGDKEKPSADLVNGLCGGLQLALHVTPGFPSTRPAGAAAFRELATIKGYDSQMHACRARLELSAGEVKFAADEFAKTKLDEDDPLRLLAAWSRIATGDRDGARDEVGQFLTARLDKGTLDANDAALATLLYKQLGESGPPALAAYVAATPDGPWPRPLLAYLDGQIDSEELLRRARQFGATTQVYALNDVWLFIGAQRQLAGDMASARHALRWYAANGIQGSRNAILARQHLRQIELSDPDLLKGLALAAGKNPDHKAAREAYLKAAARGVGRAEFELGLQLARGVLGPEDPAAAHAWYQKAAAHDDLDGMNTLGNQYEHGRGVAKDMAKAREWYERAAASGEQYASRNLANFYRYGKGGVARDAKLAFKYMTDAAELNNSDAQAELSEMHFLGEGTDKNNLRAVFWGSRAAELGNTEGLAQFAFLLAYGHGVAADPRKAVELWTIAAGKGSAAAMVQLGNAYSEGSGVDKDEKVALEWFDKASAKGNGYAAIQRGRAYFYGHGTPVDQAKARAIFTRLTELNVPEAYFWLGYIEEDQVNGSPGMKKAEQMYRLGADQGCTRCALNMGFSLQFGKAGRIDLEEAARWYRKASEQGQNSATNNLADMHENGFGMPVDLPQAIRLYRQAAQDGNATSLYSLGELNEHGKGMPANAYSAYLFYQLAANAGQEKAPEALVRVGLKLGEVQRNQAKAAAAAWKSPAPLPDSAATTTAAATKSNLQ